MFYGAMALIVVSVTSYQLTQKAMPADANPFLSLALAYVFSLAVCLALLLFFPLRTGLGEALRQTNWATYALGLSVVGIEVGFLLAYRAGWQISSAPLVANALGALVLIPAGALLFSERVTPSQAAGILLCLVGLVLINRH